MFKFFRKFFDYNEKELDRLKKRVEEINTLEDKARKLKEREFRGETKKLKEQVQEDEKKLGEVLPWGAALVREASRRVLGERHYDEQLMAGVALFEGKIAEQKTGEGKTLSATVPLYVNALAGHGVHLVTVNDYLARRDAGWMGAVFHLLGMTTSAIISDQSFLFDAEHNEGKAQDWRLSHLRQISRKEAYEADITYGINSEFGFDYLRDNMASTPDHVVQRDFFYAIVDEADSVLIDEARTPHIISAPYEEDNMKYYSYAKIVRQLDPKTDYVIDEKARTSSLTEAGVAKIESMLGVKNIYEKDFDTLFHIEASLKASTLFKKDKDYIVKDGEVIIVDEFTGRLLYGRRFSEGIHQAIEAKEGVSIQRESKTLATISLQNYFRLYKKLCGMTGTAATEAEEFHKIYKTDVVVLPTHRPMIRKDTPDMIYKTENGKFNAVVEEIASHHKTGRPILVGTTSIEKNELLSQLLSRKGIPHEVLNAKNHLQEASIIANAGKKGAVTVATNMAGRGVDIMLGGTPPSEFKVQSSKFKVEEREWQEQHDEVVRLGGLYVIGTERHESRRIDNQLRGRAGRQGDPGESRFFVSLEDDLMRIFGGEQIAKLMTFFNFPEDQPLTHSMVSKAIEQAQVKVEGFNFDIRKHLVDFDDVLSRQREIVYSLRRKILLLPEQDAKEYEKTILDRFQEEVRTLINTHVSLTDVATEDDRKLLWQELSFIISAEEKTLMDLIKARDAEGIAANMMKQIQKEYERKKDEFGESIWREISRAIFISTIDRYWTEHLTSIEDLREGINLRGYAQLDPLVEYKNEAYGMFEKLITDIHYEVTRRLFKVEKREERMEKERIAPLVYQSASRINPFSQKTPEQSHGTSSKKPGRNDPCWCGSGKKYKKCHYPN